MTLSLTLLLMLCCQAVCVAGCAACLILLTYVISLLFPMGRKNNGFWSLSFFLVSIWKCTPMHIYMKFPWSSFSKTGQLSVNTWKWDYFLSTLVFVWPCSWSKVSVHFLSFFFCSQKFLFGTSVSLERDETAIKILTCPSWKARSLGLIPSFIERGKC